MPLPLRILAALPGLLFGVIALQWLFDPAGAAAGLDLPLLRGAARSTQIGDTGAFFLGISACYLLGAIRLERQWFAAAALFVGGAAAYRVVAWALLGAALVVAVDAGIQYATLNERIAVAERSSRGGRAANGSRTRRASRASTRTTRGASIRGATSRRR